MTELTEPGAPRQRARALDVLGLLARIALGGVLIVAGALKVGSPAASARAVQAYQLLPFDVAAYVGYALPVVEILIGALLVVGLLTRPAAILGGLLMVAFVIGIASAWARGLSIDCGCFGGGGQIAAADTAYPTEIARDTALALCGVWLAARPRALFSLDRALFGY